MRNFVIVSSSTLKWQTSSLWAWSHRVFLAHRQLNTVTEETSLAQTRYASKFPLPQQTAAGRPTSSPTRIAAAATAGGLAPRRFLVDRTEVPERSITKYRTWKGKWPESCNFGACKGRTNSFPVAFPLCCCARQRESHTILATPWLVHLHGP